jgi:hypothetical protein
MQFIQNQYSAKCCKLFVYHIMDWSVLHIRNSPKIGKRCVLECRLNAALCCAFWSLSPVTLHGKMSKILSQQRTYFLTHEILAFCVWKWFIFLALILCTVEFCLKISLIIYIEIHYWTYIPCIYIYMYVLYMYMFVCVCIYIYTHIYIYIYILGWNR